MFPLAKIIDILPSTYFSCGVFLCFHLLVGTALPHFWGLLLAFLLFERLSQFDLGLRWTATDLSVSALDRNCFCWVVFKRTGLDFQSRGGKLSRRLVACQFWLAFASWMNCWLFGKHLPYLSPRFLAYTTNIFVLVSIHIPVLIGSVLSIGFFFDS